MSPAHNRYPGPCMKCGGTVPKGGGFFSRIGGGWAVVHLDCTRKRRIPSPEPIPRPMMTWLKPCAHCPSAHGPGDPESEDILANPEREEFSDFSCAWRPNGFCQGWARKMARALEARRV